MNTTTSRRIVWALATLAVIAAVIVMVGADRSDAAAPGPRAMYSTSAIAVDALVTELGNAAQG